eukprot:NODE_11140_length_470_cov_28.135447_g10485_i0.p1 GENE.NODE_11140_length_470_cov_28.135447_g10485_i0~~NODE_11140_length_470_cov_28.135447_g10485_i0.p1  ORF type:complete len:103 (-),score=4.30 NODE_11140_length_470_cov_28.135447_g10485_i0:105-413(-)
MSGKHTIVLTQPTTNPATRSYADYETVSDAMDGVCQIYETRLKQENPQFRNITYDITDLLTFLDHLTDLSCLVWSDDIRAYKPYGKEWIKQKVYQHLRKQAS